MDTWTVYGQPVWVTLKLAAVTTLCLLLVGTPMAWWLATTRSRLKSLVGAVVMLPLVLPPTVLGFYLLVGLGPQSPIGNALGAMGLPPLVFSFPGLVVASVIYSLPFAVQPLENSFESIGKRPMEVAATLRTSPLRAFFNVMLPLARPGLITAAVLGFAHTLGEFGVVLMIGGSIPGQTKVLSITIYEHVEALEYHEAHVISGALVLFSLVVLTVLYAANRRFKGIAG